MPGASETGLSLRDVHGQPWYGFRYVHLGDEFRMVVKGYIFGKNTHRPGWQASEVYLRITDQRYNGKVKFHARGAVLNTATLEAFHGYIGSVTAVAIAGWEKEIKAHVA